MLEGHYFTERLLPELGGVEWTVKGPTAILDDVLGGLNEGRWTHASRERRKAFGDCIDEKGVVVVRNARLSRWFEQLRTHEVPFQPSQPMLQRAYHYDGEGKARHVGLFHRTNGRRRYGTAVARTVDVQEAMKEAREILNPNYPPLSTIREPRIKSQLRELYQMVSRERVENIDYIRIAIVREQWMSVLGNKVERYMLKKITDAEADLELAVQSLEQFYDEVDEILDGRPMGSKRYVHDHDRGGVPSALFFHNASSAAVYNRRILAGL
jgi:hypothetical protein